MAFVRKVKRSGLTFFQIVEEIFNAAMSCSYNSARVDVLFDVCFEKSIKIVREVEDAQVPYNSKELLEVM